MGIFANFCPQKKKTLFCYWVNTKELFRWAWRTWKFEWIQFSQVGQVVQLAPQAIIKKRHSTSARFVIARHAPEAFGKHHLRRNGRGKGKHSKTAFTGRVSSSRCFDHFWSTARFFGWRIGTHIWKTTPFAQNFSNFLLNQQKLFSNIAKTRTLSTTTNAWENPTIPMSKSPLLLLG